MPTSRDYLYTKQQTCSCNEHTFRSYDKEPYLSLAVNLRATMSSSKFDLKMPKNREFLGGDLLAQSLAQVGVKVAFGIHGGHLDAFLMGCSDAGIDLVDVRHETVAVQASEAYAKVSGKVGVSFITANSG